MASNGRIEDFVSESAFQQLERVETYLSTLNITLVEGIKNAKAFSDALSGAKGLKDISTASANASKELERLRKLQEQTATATANRVAAEQRAAAAIIRTTTAQQRQTAQTDKQRLAQEKLNETNRKAQGEYAKLLQSYNQSTTAARNLGVQYGTNSVQFRAAAADANRLRSQLDAIDQPLGNFQRNVGNYATGIGRVFNRAYGAIRTAANILPGLGISGIFLLGFEGIKFVVEQLGLLGEKAGQATTNLKGLNEVNKAANSEYGDLSTKLKILYAAATDVNNKEIDRINAAKELQKLFPQTFANSTAQSIINGKEAASYKELTDNLLATARARAVANKLAEIASKDADLAFQRDKNNAAKYSELQRVKSPISSGSVGTGGTGSVTGVTSIELQRQNIKVRTDLNNKTIEQQRRLLQGEADFLIKYAGGNNKIAKAITDGEKYKADPKIADDRKKILDQQLKDALLTEQTILQNEQISYDDRILAIADYENTVSNLLAKARKDKVITALEESNYFKELDVKTAKERKDIAEKLQKEIVKAFDDGIKNANTALQQEIIDLREAQDTKLLDIEKYQSEAMQITAQQYSEGKITAAEYNQQIYDIEKQSAKDRIDLQIQTLEKILATQQDNLSFGIGDPKDIQRTQNLITKLRIDSSNLETKVILDNVEKVKTARNQLHDLEKRIADESIELIQTLVDGSYQRQLDALSAQSDQLTKNGDTEKEAVDRSLATDEEKANKKKIIDAKVQAQQEVIAQREREVKTRQAKFDKAISIARIIEATGIAEVQALTYLSNPFTAPLYPAIAAAIATLGAIQLATVIATPIPKYAKGTDYHKGGAMIVGDAGTELVIEPNGRQYLTPDTDTLTSAPKGTKVLPNHEVIRMLAKPEKINYVGGQSVDIAQLVAAQNKTTKAIQGQKMAGTFITKGGWKKQQQDIADRMAYRNNHFN